jgi:hypothetical protein
MAAVNHRRRPVDPSGSIEPAQQLAMQRRPRACALPFLQASMRRRRRAAQLPRQMPSRDPGKEHEHDRAEAHAVIDTRSAPARIRLMSPSLPATARAGRTIC